MPIFKSETLATRRVFKQTNKMISITSALEIVKQTTPLLSVETISLENVCGRVLAEDIFADMDLPPFDRSQMDGYAVKAADLKGAPVKLGIVGESAAGKGWHHELKSGEAVRIMTGAPVPTGADAVQKVELSGENGDFVEIFEVAEVGKNIVQRASEIQKGEKLFSVGEIVNTAMIASLASFGYSYVKVGKCPRVSILATGSEIVPVDQIPAQDEIRNSNTATLNAYAEKCGAIVEALPVSGDDIAALELSISNSIEKSDVLILSGGVSVGKYDFTKAALRELGAEVFFEKVALRPGKPTVFAKINDTLIFGLPGNPVSAIVTFNLFVRTAILQMQGAVECELKSGFAVITDKLKGAKERDSLLPARLTTNEFGQLLAEPINWRGSSDFVSFSKADALIFVPQNTMLEAEAVAKIHFLPN